ncbi:MAG: DUF58 domain-containing protein [Planctomycetota bacterium]|jgi:uncharacterized protein (DUF58 family)
MAFKVKGQVEARGQKYLKPEDLLYLKNLYFAARVIVEGAYCGRHKSPVKGYSQEFTDYREYNPGDEIRTIDWKAYARTDRYFIKLFEKETVMTCYLLLDSSASMGFGGQGYEKFFGAKDVSKFDYACYLAAALCYLTVKQGDKVALTLFDSKIKSHVPPGSTYSHLYGMLDQLERNEVGAKTSISTVLRQALPLFKRKGVLILVSDLLDDPDHIFGALDMYRHKNFEVVLFHVLHKYELELPMIPSVNFIDAESSQRLTTIPADIRDLYRREVLEYVETLSSAAQAHKIDYQLLSTEVPYQVALQQYINKRTR